MTRLDKPLKRELRIKGKAHVLATDLLLLAVSAVGRYQTIAGASGVAATTFTVDHMAIR